MQESLMDYGGMGAWAGIGNMTNQPILCNEVCTADQTPIIGTAHEHPSKVQN
jgi:hypothetical protein